MNGSCALTTFDNPYNPFEQFSDWFLFDVEKGYNTCAYLDRIAHTSDQFSEEENKAHNSKSVKSMSDAELRNRLNRLQMEKQYSQLSSTDVNRGKEYVSKTLKVAGTIATATSTALTIYNNYGKIKEIVNGMAKKAG